MLIVQLWPLISLPRRTLADVKRLSKIVVANAGRIWFQSFFASVRELVIAVGFLWLGVKNQLSKSI